MARRILGLARNTDLPRQCLIQVRPSGEADVPVLELAWWVVVFWRTDSVVLPSCNVGTAVFLESNDCGA